MPTENELQQLARQLSNPEGDFGLEVAKEMHKSNFGMIQSAIRSLSLKPGDQILEIGHGNAAHLEYLLSLSEEISYTGLEISETMHTEAKAVNSHLGKGGKISFCSYEGLKIPFEDNSFTKIFSVNTVYFWSDPFAFAREIRRVLHPSGKFSLAFAQRRFMERLPFTRFGFQLYNTPDLVSLFENAGMIIETIEDFEEEIQSKSGEKVTRQYTVLQCSGQK